MDAFESVTALLAAEPSEGCPFLLLFSAPFLACFFATLFAHFATLLAPLLRFCAISDGFWAPFWFPFGILLLTFDITFLNFVVASFLDGFFMDFRTPATSKTMLLLK